MTGSPVPPDVLADPKACGAAWERWLDRTGLSDNTKRTYRGEVRSYVAWLGGQHGVHAEDVFADLHARDYAWRDYRRHLLTVAKRSPKGVETAMTGLSSIYKWVGLGPAKVPREGRSQRAPKALGADDTRKVLRAAERRGRRDLAIVALGVNVGLRISELAALDRDDLWVTERLGELQVRYGKGGRPRKVPLNGQVRQALSGWLLERPSWPGADGPALLLSRTGARLSSRSIHYAVSESGKAAGVDVSPHILRHTFGTTRVRAGVDLVAVGGLMGHSSTDTTAIYARASAEDAARAVEIGVVDF